MSISSDGAQNVSQLTAAVALANGATIYGTGPYNGQQLFFATTGTMFPGGVEYFFGSGGGGGSTAAPPPTVVSISTGVNPNETAYSLYGHTVPLSVFGFGRIGGEIISGPWVDTATGLASFCISFGVPADPSGTRDLREIAFDSEVVWTAAGGFTNLAFTYRFYPGTLTQAADPLETTHFPGNEVAYRPQMLIWFENLNLATTKFGKIPYVAAVIGDASGDDVNLGEAFERLAYSPWVGYTSAEFETVGITDGLVGGGLILAQDYDFLGLIQLFGRFYPTWDILQTDKLRISDRGSTTAADITLDTTNLMGAIGVTRQGVDTIKKELELSTIDPDADYTIIPSTARTPTDPVVVTTSVGKDSVYLPAIMDASTRASIVTFAKYHEEVARKTIKGTAMAFGLEMEPGALVRIQDLSSAFYDETFKVVETLHGANYAVEFTAASMFKCNISGFDSCWNNVVLLLSFDGADASTIFTDESPSAHGNAVVFNNAQVDTALSQFGGGSGLFNGTTDCLEFPDSPDWRLSPGIWTVECWIRPTSLAPDRQMIVGQWGNLAPFDGQVDLSWALRVRYDTLAFETSVTGLDNEIPVQGGTLVVDTWQAVCADYDGSSLRIYIDGVMVDKAGPSTAPTSFADGTKPLAIGANSDEFAFFFNGNIDELRITKGCARYASDSGYTVATSAFPRF